MANGEFLLAEKDVEVLIFIFIKNRKNYPSGTTLATFTTVKMSDLRFNNPPIGGPNYEQKRFAIELQHEFNDCMLKIPSPVDIFLDGTKTLGDLCDFCFNKQKELA